MRDTKEWRKEIRAWRRVHARRVTLLPFFLPQGIISYAVAFEVGDKRFSSMLGDIEEEAAEFALTRVLDQLNATPDESARTELHAAMKGALSRPIERITSRAFIGRGIVDRETGFGDLVLRRALGVLRGLTEEELIALYRASRVEAVLES